jgi:hypothetical protein
MITSFASKLLQSVTQRTVNSIALRVPGLLSGLCPPSRSQGVDCSSSSEGAPRHVPQLHVRHRVVLIDWTNNTFPKENTYDLECGGGIFIHDI